jgi:hypothetical protein
MTTSCQLQLVSSIGELVYIFLSYALTHYYHFFQNKNYGRGRLLLFKNILQPSLKGFKLRKIPHGQIITLIQ